MKVTYNGQDRFVTRRATYGTVPDLGAIVGPNTTGEYMVVVATEGNKALFAFASEKDMDDSLRNEFPRSLTEVRVKAIRG